MADAEETDKPIVWLVNKSFEPRGSAFYTLRLALELPTLGFKPVVICESSERIPRRVLSQIDVRVVPRLTKKLFRSLRLVRLVRQTESAPALIHSQRLGLEWIGGELAEEFEAPHVVTVHNTGEEPPTLAVRPDQLDALIAVSPTVQQVLARMPMLPAGVLRLIPSGVDVPDSPRLPPPRDPDVVPVVGTASVLEPSKGIMHFLMAAELILSSGHDVEFVIAGTGPDEEILRRAAQHLDIANRVTFAPHVTSFTQILETFDVFVLPSLEQGLGTVMLEAMALGKPVVATRVGGVPDFVVDGEHAFLVDKENHAVLADKIEQLLDFPDKARKLAVAGQELVRRQFSSERMAADTAKVYRELLPAIIPARS